MKNMNGWSALNSFGLESYEISIPTVIASTVAAAASVPSSSHL